MPQPPRFHRRLDGWRAIVTGAGTLGDGVGTGKAIAALFAAEGARVALLDLEADRAETTLDLVRELGGEGLVVAGDVADPADAAPMVAASPEWHGGLAVLGKNTGKNGSGSGREKGGK